MATFTGDFKKGMKIGGSTYKDFELRELTTADLLDAELISPSNKPMNFNAAMASLQLVRVGDYTGPFTLNMIRALHPKDYDAIVDGLNEVAKLGED